MDHNRRHPFPSPAIPCPFCGSRALALEERYVVRSPGRAPAFYVNCDGCRANGPWEVAVSGSEVPQALVAAVKRWNLNEVQQLRAFLNDEVMPRYAEMFEAAGLGNASDSVVIEMARDLLGAPDALPDA